MASFLSRMENDLNLLPSILGAVKRRLLMEVGIGLGSVG